MMILLSICRLISQLIVLPVSVTVKKAYYDFPQPKVTSSCVFFRLNNSPKPRRIQFTMFDSGKQQLLPFEKLKQANVLLFCFICEWNWPINMIQDRTGVLFFAVTDWILKCFYHSSWMNVCWSSFWTDVPFFGFLTRWNADASVKVTQPFVTLAKQKSASCSSSNGVLHIINHFQAGLTEATANLKISKTWACLQLPYLPLFTFHCITPRTPAYTSLMSRNTSFLLGRCRQNF